MSTRHPYFYKEPETGKTFNDMFSLIKYVNEKGKVTIDCYYSKTKKYNKTKTFMGIEDMGTHFLLKYEENKVLDAYDIPFTLKEVLA